MSLNNNSIDKKGKSWEQGFHKKNSKILSGDPELQFITFTYENSDISSETTKQIQCKSGVDSDGGKTCPCNNFKKDIDIDQETRQDMLQFLNRVFEEKKTHQL